MGVATLKPKITKIDTRLGTAPTTQRIRGWQLTKIRRRIGIRDGYTCQACGGVTVAGEVDHVMPLHLGGAEGDENRQWLCKDCHSAKSAQEEKGRGGSNLRGE